MGGTIRTGPSSSDGPGLFGPDRRLSRKTSQVMMKSFNSIRRKIMYVELHLLQNFAPANLNRDDTNNPKDCEFGGYRRARISSQCLKRAIRRDPVFQRTTGAEQGQRTKWFTRLLVKPLEAAGKAEAEATTVA